MGYGYGRTTSHGNDIAYDRNGKRVSSRFSNDMVAHVFARQTQTFGQSSNGNAYFRDRIAYSYGSHYPTAVMMTGDTVVINADSTSPTTNGHLSDMRGATSHLSRIYMPALQSIADRLSRLADGKATDHDKAALRDYLSEYATALVGHRMSAPHSWERDGITGADYIGGLIGLRPVNIAKIVRETAKREADKQAEADKAKAFRAFSRAIELGQMSDDYFKRFIREALSNHWNAEHRIGELAKELHRSRGIILKTGKHKKVLASLRERLAYVRALDVVRQARISERQRVKRIQIGYIRQWTKASREGQWNAKESAYRTLIEAADKMAATLPDIAGTLKASLIALMNNGIEALEGIREEQERLDALADADRVLAWQGGANISYFQRRRMSDDKGGALMRIVGDTLETSWGAEVPLAHAIKAFRFVKLCKERGTDWRRNGHSIHVGHFVVDSISANGSFVAGCHSFNWPEIERVARLAGVIDAVADDSAIVSSH